MAIIDEPVRGSVPPLWWWSLPGLERMQVLAGGLIPLPPLCRLLGIRPGHAAAAAIRAEISRCHGTEIDTAGDGFFLHFDSPAEALECAIAAREAVKPLGIEIRAGIHTEECEVTGRNHAGMAVHIGARIQAAAGASEIFVSSTVKDLVMGSGRSFADKGEHELKGVPGTWRLYSLA